MFERYTEKARRVVFLARYEASAHGVREIDTRCLLLGILREDKDLMGRLAPQGEDKLSRLWTEAEALFQHSSQKVSTTIDLPLNRTARLALELAAEVSGRRHAKCIEPRHILWGLFQAGGPEVRCMNACGFTVEAVNSDLDWLAAGTNELERHALRMMIDNLPKDRLDAAAVLLAGLSAERFEVTGTGPAGPFRFVFGSEPGTA
jgi:ATP-dependent Clp protease ATP-binding subunit ClpA